jgi:hypothetical protein
LDTALDYLRPQRCHESITGTWTGKNFCLPYDSVPPLAKLRYLKVVVEENLFGRGIQLRAQSYSVRFINTTHFQLLSTQNRVFSYNATSLKKLK